MRSVFWPLSPHSYKNVSVTTAFLLSPKSVMFFRSDPLWIYVEYYVRALQIVLSSILFFQNREQTLYRGYSDSKLITNYSILAWFEVLTAVLLKNQAFWDVTLYPLVVSYGSFGSWWLYVQVQAVEAGGTLLLRNVSICQWTGSKISEASNLHGVHSTHLSALLQYCSQNLNRTSPPAGPLQVQRPIPLLPLQQAAESRKKLTWNLVLQIII